MKKDVCGRIARLALIAFVLYGATFGALFLRGMYYVQPTADNWRLLPYIVPAASYEQCIHSIQWQGSMQRLTVSISCKDAQGREIRGIVLHKDSLLPYYTDISYDGNTQTVRNREWRFYSVDRVTTDELGRDIRYDYDDGSYAVMEYEGDSGEYSLSLSCDAQGTLTGRHTRTRDGNTEYILHEDGAGNPQYEVLYTLDGRGNILSAQSTTWREGVPETDTEQYIWEYDDAEGTETCISEDGQTDRIWYDGLGRPIRQETTLGDGSRHLSTIVYTDITRR